MKSNDWGARVQHVKRGRKSRLGAELFIASCAEQGTGNKEQRIGDLQVSVKLTWCRSPGIPGGLESSNGGHARLFASAEFLEGILIPAFSFVTGPFQSSLRL